MPAMFRISPWKVWLDGHEPWLRDGYTSGNYSDARQSRYYKVTPGGNYSYGKEVTGPKIVGHGQAARVEQEMRRGSQDHREGKIHNEQDHVDKNNSISVHDNKDHIKGTRDSERFVSLSTMLEENVLKDEDVILLKADATAVIDSLIVQHKIWRKPEVRQFSQSCILLSLPLEMFLSVVAYLGVKDVENLGMTCKGLNNLTRRIFVPRVLLPLSEKNLDLLDGRFVLSLSSNVSIGLWGVNNEYEQMLKKLNLIYVKEVKFVGNNYKVNYGGLTSSYKRILGNIFLSKKFVRKLDISIDSTEECYRQLQSLKEMPFLNELCLRSSGGFSQAQIYERTLNEILKDTLKELKIQTFELKGFIMPWDDSGFYELQIYSKTIRKLKLSYSKNMELTDIVAGNLKELLIASDSIYNSYCLFHAPSTVFVTGPSDPPSRLAVILARGCPNLEKYNGMDLTSMSRNGSWLEELVHHKGEGVHSEYGEAQSCVQCSQDDDDFRDDDSLIMCGDDMF